MIVEHLTSEGGRPRVLTRRGASGALARVLLGAVVLCAGCSAKSADPAGERFDDVR